MRLAKIIGQVVATVRNPNLGMDKLLLVQMLDGDGKPEPKVQVAVDNLGAGAGEWVLVVAGSSARNTVASGNSAPVDLSVVGIVDEVSSVEGLNYSKNA